MLRKAITVWVRKRYPKNEIEKLEEEELNRKKYEQKEDDKNRDLLNIVKIFMEAVLDKWRQLMSVMSLSGGKN